MAVKAQDVIAPKRRRLTDLYLVGREVEIDDGTGEPIKFWLSKLSPVEQRDAADAATAKRAKILALKHVKDDVAAETQLAVYEEQIDDMGVKTKDTMIDFLIAPKLQEALTSAQERIATEGKWGENDYLNSLQKAWNEGLSDKYATDPEDEDAIRVYKELVTFTEEVNEALKEDREYLRGDFETLDEDTLKKKVLDRVIEAESDFAWVNEFSRWQVYYGVRLEDDHKQRYFESREEVDMLDAKVLNFILENYQELTVDPIEGKDSEETPSS